MNKKDQSNSQHQLNQEAVHRLSSEKEKHNRSKMRYKTEIEEDRR